MPPLTVKVAEQETDDRFSRLRLIPWWDQEKIRSTNVLVDVYKRQTRQTS